MADAVGSDSILLGSTASGFVYNGRNRRRKHKGLLIALFFVTVMIAGIITIIYLTTTGSSESSVSPTPAPINTYLLHSPHINVQQVHRISRFRSGVGGDWPGMDSFFNTNQTCGSFKHWFQPFASLNFKDVDIISPLTGTIIQASYANGEDESYGWDIQIRGTAPDYPDVTYTVSIGHVNITDHDTIAKDQIVQNGTILGHHIGNFVDSDIAVLNRSSNQYISIFLAMDDPVLAQYQKWNVTNRTYPIISYPQRMKYELNCTADGSIVNDSNNGVNIPNWVTLNTTYTAS